MNKQSDSTAAEQFLRETYLLVEISGLRINGVKWTELLTEFAALESAKEEQLFAEFCSTWGWIFDRTTGIWTQLVFSDGLAVYTNHTTAELYNSKEYQLYKEGKG